MREFERKEKEYEDAIAHRYNRDYHRYPLMQTQDKDFASFAAQHYHSGDRVLDLGCGPASLWHLWEEKLEDPGSLIGVDLSEKMINECKRSFPRGDFRVGSVFEIPVEASGIDLIIASSVLHHIPDEHLPKAFKEMDRVLDEHGTIVGREPVSTGRLGDIPGWFSLGFVFGGAITSNDHTTISPIVVPHDMQPTLEPQQRAHAPQLDFDEVSRAAAGSFNSVGSTSL